MLTKLALFATDSSTALLHEVLKRSDALSWWMADLCALVSAVEHLTTLFAAVEVLVLAESVRKDFLSAMAEPGHLLEAWRTVACMAVHGALMTTLELLRARLAAGRWLHTALDRRICLFSSTSAVERLIRDPLARLAEADMAEVSALVDTAREHLLAGDHAEVSALRIASWPKGALDRAADILASVLATALHLTALALALDLLVLVDLFLSHEETLLLLRVVDFVALDLGLGLPTSTRHIDDDIAARALAFRVALLVTLVEPTGQVSITWVVTCRDWLRAV